MLCLKSKVIIDPLTNKDNQLRKTAILPKNVSVLVVKNNSIMKTKCCSSTQRCLRPAMLVDVHHLFELATVPVSNPFQTINGLQAGHVVEM